MAIRDEQPYTFVPVAFEDDDQPAVHDVIFHDGKQPDRLTGLIQCTLTAKTPLLVGHYQYPASEVNGAVIKNQRIKLPKTWGMVAQDRKFDYQRRNNKDICKSIIEPLFGIGTNITEMPVLINGTSIKGMLRQTIGAMTNAPMERVADNEGIRPYSYRPGFVRIQPNDEGRYKKMKGQCLGVPTKNQALRAIFPKIGTITIDSQVVNNWIRSEKFAYDDKNFRKLEEDGDIFAEYDTEKEQIVSFGKHELYRWTFADSTRDIDLLNALNQKHKRPEVSKADREEVTENKSELTGARNLFGYVDGGKDGKNNELNLGIGKRDYSRLAGRISVNCAVEQLNGKNITERFVCRTGEQPKDQNQFGWSNIQSKVSRKFIMPPCVAVR